MSDTLDPLLLNFIYACFGGFLTLFFMWFGCKVFSHIVNFSIPDELAKGNLAVGLMIYVLLVGPTGVGKTYIVKDGDVLHFLFNA